MEKKNNFALVAIFLLTLVFFGFILNLYFSQDDFFHLKVSQTDGSLREFIELFSFRSFEDRGGIYFYRPIFREGLFNIFGTLFGLNPIPFRILQFIIHLVNVFLVYKLVFRIVKNKIVSTISALVFGISSANIGVLTYLAGGIQASGMTMFLLLSMINFSRRKLLAFLFFLLALASHELAVIYPVLLLNKKAFVKSIKNILPYLVIVIIYIFLQVKVVGLPTGETEYGLNFSLSRIINSYVWYFAWGLGIPEMLLDFVGPGINLNPNLMMYWGTYFRAIFPLFGLILIGLIAAMKRLVRNKQVWLFVYWFIVGISPVVILPLHRSTYYLAPVLPAIGAIVGFVFYEIYIRKKPLAILFISAFVVLSFLTINLSRTTFWAITRAKIAKNLIEKVKDKYPILPDGAVVYFTNDPEYPNISDEWGGSSGQAKVALSGSDALQLVYRDSTLKVYYEDDERIPSDPYFPMVAVLKL